MSNHNQLYMKLKYIILGALPILFWACDNLDEKAEQLYKEASTAFKENKFNTAKILIDSIKSTYPKAFETRKKTIRLMQEIEIAEQERAIENLDSIKNIMIKQYNNIKCKYLYIKDSLYQDYGTFICPEQDLRKYSDRSMLYASVDERGIMKITSIYLGQRAIEHHSIKIVSTDDNSFIETKYSDNHYSTSLYGMVNEKTEYELGKTDNGLIEFIIYNKNKNLYMEYNGIHPYKRKLTKTEVESIESIYNLTKTIKTITEINEQEKEANNKINFYKKKMDTADNQITK